MTCLIAFCIQESFPWGCLLCKLVGYSKYPRIRTYIFGSQAPIGSYFKDADTNFKV